MMTETTMNAWKVDILHAQTKKEIDGFIKRFRLLDDEAKNINEANQWRELIQFAKERRFMTY